MILAVLFIFLPAYLGNSMPIFVGSLLKSRFDTPVDFGKKIYGRRITGDHKTWRGIFAGVFGGVLGYYVQKLLYVHNSYFQDISLLDFNAVSVWFGVALGFGAIMGDLVKSIFKRQLGISPGKDWFLFDQLDYVIGGLIGLSFFMSIGLELLLWIVGVSFVLHIVSCYLGKGLKKKANEK